jgi:hypothetical protein
MAVRIGFGMEPLQWPVSLNKQRQALRPFQLTAEQCGAADQAANSDRGGGIGSLPPPRFLNQSGGCGGRRTQCFILGKYSDQMIFHGKFRCLLFPQSILTIKPLI